MPWTFTIEQYWTRLYNSTNTKIKAQHYFHKHPPMKLLSMCLHLKQLSANSSAASVTLLVIRLPSQALSVLEPTTCIAFAWFEQTTSYARLPVWLLIIASSIIQQLACFKVLHFYTTVLLLILKEVPLSTLMYCLFTLLFILIFHVLWDVLFCVYFITYPTLRTN